MKFFIIFDDLILYEVKPVLFWSMHLLNDSAWYGEELIKVIPSCPSIYPIIDNQTEIIITCSYTFTQSQTTKQKTEVIITCSNTVNFDQSTWAEFILSAHRSLCTWFKLIKQTMNQINLALTSLLVSECGFESRPRPWCLCPWARHFTIIASLHPGVNGYLWGQSWLLCLIELYTPQGAEMVSGMIYVPDEQG